MGAGEWIKRVDFWMLGIAAFLVTRLLLPTSTLSRETLLKVLEQLSEECFHIFSEMAYVVQSTRRKAASKLAPEQDEILAQRSIKERLDEAQERVAAKHGTSAEALEAARSEFADDFKVKLYVDGLAQMHDDCRRGLMPVMPGVEIPGDLTHAAMLQTLEGIAAEKLARIEAAVKAYYANTPRREKAPVLPPRELTEAIQKAYDESEAEVLGARGINPLVHKSALHLYLRDEKFATARANIDKRFQDGFKAALTP
jgi:hypothetical protein